VVRLPRDWLGPREELVPIGAAAGGPPHPGEPVAEAPTAWPPTAHDFWGEDSAALHDAMQAPPEAGQSAPQTPELTPATPSRRALTVRWPLVLTASAAAVALVIWLIGASEGPPTTRRPTMATARASNVDASTPLAGFDPARDRSRTAALHLEVVAATRALRRPAHLDARPGHLHRASAHPGDRVSPSVRPQISAASATEPVDRGATPGYASQAAAAPQPSGTSEDQTEAASSDASAAGDSASGQPAGPSGRVALIGSGTSPSG
jgi:hypothetical protein